MNGLAIKPRMAKHKIQETVVLAICAEAMVVGLNSKRILCLPAGTQYLYHLEQPQLQFLQLR